MSLLIFGVVLWSLIHFLPSLGQQWRHQIQERIGEGSYKGLFSLIVLISLACIIWGWRTTSPVLLYSPPNWGEPVAMILMVIAFILFGASHRPSMLKSYIRHPQLSAVIVWSVAHLLANGDNRGLILFGALGIWALLSIPAINARQGEWVKPKAPAAGTEIKGLAVTAIIFIIALLLHPYYSGVNPVIH